LFHIRQQLNRRGQRLAAETDVGNPTFTLHFHQQQPVGTRRDMRRIGQHHAPQKAAHGKTDLAQRSFQQAILLEAVAAATRMNQLLFQGSIVEMYLSGQQHIQIFKGIAPLWWICSSRRVLSETSGVPVQPRRENQALKNGLINTSSNRCPTFIACFSRLTSYFVRSHLSARTSQHSVPAR
jgi:hypothetical protein